MKKIGTIVREKIVTEIKDRVNTSAGCVFVGFNKVPAVSFSTLRNKLHLNNTTVFVAKNTLLNQAFKELGYGELGGMLPQETGLVCVYDKDMVQACKTISEFAKENENLKIAGGFLKDKKMSPADISTLSKLPSKDILLAMALGTMVAPLTGFLGCMKQVTTKFVRVVDGIQKKKT